MLKRVEEYIRKYNMIEPKDHVVVGVSGGADSVCLLDILSELAKKMDFTITAVHVNHLIRGEEADRDETYVRKLCARYGVTLICKQIDVPQRAKLSGESLEEAGRKARYESFENIEGVTKIAVAHHADDQAETIIHNIVRGSSIKGAGGMRPVRGRIIRPLLCVRRVEIEQYLDGRGIEFCTDTTNLSVEYTRNRIRNKVIPYLTENINKDTVSNINELAGDLSECYEYVRNQAGNILDESMCSADEGCVILNVSVIKNVPALIRREIVMLAINQLIGTLKDVTRNHVCAVDELIFKNVSKKVNLPYDIEVVRGYETLEFRRGKQDAITDDAVLEIDMVVEDFDGDWEKLTNDYTKVFDYDKIKGGLILRKRMPGDYITIDDTGRKKSLKTFFIDEKIPREQRDKIWLLAEGSHILWVIGHRTGAACKTDNSTKKILKITLRRNGYDI